MASPSEGLHGFGDFVTFYRVAQIPGLAVSQFLGGVPTHLSIHFRVILPSGRRPGIHLRLPAGFPALAGRCWQFAVVYASVQKVVWCGGEKRVWIYLVVLVSLAYTWWYFDPLAVFFLLLALTLLFEGRDVAGGVALAAGILTKFFPVLVLVMVWRYFSRRRAVLVSVVALGIVVLVFTALTLVSPDFTRASLASQGSKGSWETIWALLDGNMQTGNFGSLADRLVPALAYTMQRNPPVVPPAATLVIFGGFGLWALFRAREMGVRQALSFLGLAWALMLLWSPGWSPQWVLYLIPLILLTLPEREALLMVVTLILVNLLEWPVLLSRSATVGLWVTIPLRTLLFILLAAVWYGQLKMAGRAPGSAEAASVISGDQSPGA